MARSRFAFALVALAFSSYAAAQISVEVTPNPAPIGAPITVTVTDSSGVGIQLPSSCTWFDVRQGSQSGPIVGPGGFCAQVIVPVGPNQSFSFGWDQTNSSTGLQVPPGRYWIRTNVFTSTFATINDWFCVDIQDPSEPSMTANGIVQVNNLTTFDVSSPAHPNELYGVLFSFDQNTPLAVPGIIDLCLSAPIFSVGSGTLDGTGFDNSFQFFVPNQSALAFSGFHLQTIIVDQSLNFIDTNALSLTIQP